MQAINTTTTTHLQSSYYYHHYYVISLTVLSTGVPFTITCFSCGSMVAALFTKQ